MFPRLLSTAAISAIALSAAACSAGDNAAVEVSPESAAVGAQATSIDTVPVSLEMAATPAAAPAAAPAVEHMEQVEHAAMTAPAAKPAPAPAPIAAPDEDEQSVAAHASAVTNHTLPIDHIKNFKLADQTGKVHELYKMTDAKAIVLTMHTKGCPIGQQLVPDFKALQGKYEARGVKFLMLNSNLYDTPAAIAEEVKSFGSTIPVLKDTDQSVAEPLGVERATETLVIQPGTWKILYQGPISDRVTYGRARAKADHEYVGGVLDLMLAGKKVTPSFIAPEGCILVFDNRKS